MNYFEKRMIKTVGLTSEQNEIQLKNGRLHYFCKAGENGEIIITPLKLNRETYKHAHSEATPEKPNRKNEIELIWHYVRFTPEQEKTTGIKSKMPKGVSPIPFIPKKIIEKYEAGTKIKTLILTEGFIKAIKCDLSGLDVIGLPSITQYKESETKGIYNDVYDIINACSVEAVVLLYDSDCVDISLKCLQNKTDLSIRPNQFINSALAIKELLFEFEISVFFATGKDSNYKGIDDLLQVYPQAYDEFSTFKTLSGKHFEKINITRKNDKLYTYFGLNTVEEFYKKHKDIIGQSNFIFKKNEYEIIDETPIKKIDKEKFQYIRVGDDYLKQVEKIDRWDNVYKTFEPRKRQTIIDDFNKDIVKLIQKFDDFCVIPNNNGTYKRVINNNFNLYNPLNHKLEEGEFKTIESLIRHIFGEQYEKGLDYIQLLYSKPTHKLPILCLVSVENQTGKTTFADFLCDIFGQNAVIIGNQDLESQFNNLYANKLLIIVDESKIDKSKVLEKIKSMATQKTINLNVKYMSQHTLPFHGKLILLSNYEDNFITAKDEDIRYWVRKIPKIESFDPEYENKLRLEIPAFLHFINNRELKTKKSSRMWFSPEDIETIKLDEIRQQSKPTLQKDICEYFTSYFYNNQTVEEVLCTPIDIKECWFLTDKNISVSYIRRVIKENFKKSVEAQQRYTNLLANTIVERNGTPFLFKRREFINELNEVIFDEKPF